MAKKFTFNAQTPTPSDTPQIDFGAYNTYLVNTVGCSKKPEPQIGIISGVIDLGLQKQDDAKMQWKGDAASEQAELDAERAKTGKEPLQYFETLPDDKGVPTRYKRWPVKAQRCVALTFDVPTIKVNYGQFFAEDKVGREVPFRGLLNNEFGIKGVGKVVGKPYSLREQRNDDGTWSLKNNTILFKIGQATEQLDEKGNFKPAYLGNLIGEAAMFNVQVSTTKVGEKEFLNEKMSFGGPIPQMMKAMVPTLDEEFMYMINFVGEQDMNALKQLRQSVINTMKQAEDFEGSDVQKALIELGRVKAGEGAAPAATQERAQTPAQASAPAPQTETIDFDSFDDDIPF